MRTFRPTPTVVAVVLFCVAGNLLVLWSLPEETHNAPEDDAWILYYALVYADELPASLDAARLAGLVVDLDRGTGDVARRFSVVSWERRDAEFRAVVRHRDGPAFTLTADGVSHGG